METDPIKGLVTGAVILLTVAAIVLTGMAVVTQFETVLKSRTDVTNESITITSGAADTTNDDLTDVTSFSNGSRLYIQDNVSESDLLNWTVAGNIIWGWEDNDYNISYTYLADTTASLSAGNFRTGLAIFGTFAGVLAISIIGIMIVRLLKKKS